MPRGLRILLFLQFIILCGQALFVVMLIMALQNIENIRLLIFSIMRGY